MDVASSNEMPCRGRFDFFQAVNRRHRHPSGGEIFQAVARRRNRSPLKPRKAPRPFNFSPRCIHAAPFPLAAVRPRPSIRPAVSLFTARPFQPPAIMRARFEKIDL
jgi:hypothetical protein